MKYLLLHDTFFTPLQFHFLVTAEKKIQKVDVGSGKKCVVIIGDIT